MQKNYFQLATFLLLVLADTGLHAQEVLPASGGNASGSGGSLAYSVGQIVYTTNAGTNGSSAQGVQQPYEILTVDVAQDAAGINLVASAYPNPTNENLTLSIDNIDISDLAYQLYDDNGRLLETNMLKNKMTCIIMSGLVPAIYFLKVIQNSKELKIFKIIKN